ncbi:MAG: cobyric acid synthase [Acidobacteriota bacterium]|nr:cobyric acid synthase [Acidobacteriota bacterium]MDE3082377.1 cobyric acid synthase [Acidobacteriota bacterium]
MEGSLLVLGTSSGAGKSTFVTGVCRWLRRQGVAVAPFKAQNMSLNSYVTSQHGEMGRAQVVQAQAAGVEPDVRMNPVLLKPGTDTRSQMVVMGQPVGELDAQSGWRAKGGLLDLVVEAYRDLRRDYDVVICEGAGSPAEVNLRHSDIVNLGFARAADVPAILLGDIDRGGVFASLVGTLAVLDGPDQDVVKAFVINRFRGTASLLSDGLVRLSEMTDRPVLGLLPMLAGRGIDEEDAIDVASWRDGAAPIGEDVLVVGVVIFPRASNLTDLDPLLDEPGVVVRPLYRPEAMEGCDLVILPGTRATVADLDWLRTRGFDRALARRAARGRAIMGICGGYQMLGTVIHDDVESAAGEVKGLGLLPVNTLFGERKVLNQTREILDDASVVTGYQIHHGRVSAHGGRALIGEEGCVEGAVSGTTWHGLFENDDWRRQFLEGVGRANAKRFVASRETCFADRREARINAIADTVEAYVDRELLLSLIRGRSGSNPRRLSLGFS